MKSKAKFILLSLFLLYVASCLTSVEVKGLYEMYGIDDKVYLPAPGVLECEHLGTLTPAIFKKLHKQIKPSDPDIFYGEPEDAFILEGDTLLIGLRYTPRLNVTKRLTGFALVDTSGTLEKVSNGLYLGLQNPSYFQGKVYLTYQDGKPFKGYDDYWKLLVSANQELADPWPYQKAYSNVRKALLSKSLIPEETDYSPHINHFFTDSTSYVMDVESNQIFSFDNMTGEISIYKLPLEHPVIRQILSGGDKNLEGALIDFHAVVGDYAVFASSVDWYTLLINMKTNQVYIFYSSFIAEKFGIINVRPAEYGCSGYQIFPTKNYLYYLMLTTHRDYHIVRVKLN